MRSIIFLLTLLFSCSVAQAEIIETNNASDIKKQIEKLSAGDIALFDVKDVIFYSEDQVMSTMHKSVFKDKFKEIKKIKGKEETDRLISIVLDSYKPVLVDEKIPQIIELAQKAGILVFGLTSGKTSKYGIIENRADTRINTLKTFGVDFSKSMDLPYMDLGVGDDIDKTIENGNSMFQDGIIFASRIPKGEILGRFLERAKLHPKKIIFVDNRLKNINLVCTKAQELGIEYVGIYFTKLSRSPYKHLDQNIVDKKFEILLKDGKWINDQEAQNMLK